MYGRKIMHQLWKKYEVIHIDMSCIVYQNWFAQTFTIHNNNKCFIRSPAIFSLRTSYSVWYLTRRVTHTDKLFVSTRMPTYFSLGIYYFFVEKEVKKLRGCHYSRDISNVDINKKWIIIFVFNFMFPWSICNGCGMPARNAYPSGHLFPSPIVGLACAPIVETKFFSL